MADKVLNKIIVLEPSSKLTTELLGLIREKNIAEIVTTNSTDEALQEVISSLPCMMVVGILENADVPTRIQLFKRLEGAIKHHGLKIYVVSPLKNRQLADLATQKMGVADYIVEPVPVRTMLFKANLQLKAVDNFRRQQELKKQADEKIVIKKLDGGKKVDAAGNEIKNNLKPPLEKPEDTFLFKNSGVKKAGKKFSVELEGPDPSTGEWVEHEDKGNAQSSWRWVPHEEKEDQAQGKKPKEGWVHEGDKPLFNENSQKWTMTSEKPSLALVQKGEVTARKLGVDEKGEVFVAEDSPQAEENLRKNRLKVSKKKEKPALVASASEDSAQIIADKPAPLRTEGEPGTGKENTPQLRKSQGPGTKNLDLKPGEAGLDAEAGRPKDRRDPLGNEPARALKDKRTAAEPAGVTEEAEAENIAEEEEEDDPLGRKARLKQRQEERARAEASLLKADPASTGVNPLDPDEDAEAPMGAAQRRKTKTGIDPLDRLNARLTEEEPEEEKDPDRMRRALGIDDDEVAPEGPVLGIKGREKTEEEMRDKLRNLLGEETGEFNDRQDQGDRLKRLRDLKKETLKEIQTTVARKLPEDISSEEEEKLLDELGLRGRPGIKRKDLARKKRLKDVKDLKDRLTAIDFGISEEQAKGEAQSGRSLTEEEKTREHGQGDLRREQLKGIRGARDSLDEEIAEEAREKLRRAAHQKKDSAELSEPFCYVPEAEIQPLGNAWEATGDHYVYLNASVRYKGFARMDDLLPLWFYGGPQVPELLDKTKQWRFRGAPPEQARKLIDLPAEIRDFLTALRDQLEGSRRAEAGEEAENAEADDKALRDEPGKESLRGPGRDSADTLADSGGENEETKRDGTAAAASEDFSRKKNREEYIDDPALSAEENAERKLVHETAEPAKSAGSDGQSTAEDSMARLRAKLGMDEKGESGDAEESRKDEEAENSGDDLTARGKKPLGGEEESLTDKLAERPEFQTESMQKFLERRKKKKEEASAAEAAGATTASAVSAISPGAANAAAPTPEQGKLVYLGVLIALADAAEFAVDPAKTLTKVLNSMEMSYGRCFTACTSAPDGAGQAVVRHRSSLAPPVAEKIQCEGALAVPITRATSGREEVLGYLVVKATEDRPAFSPAEEKVTREVAARLWPLLIPQAQEKIAA